ncbi:hypothetical protein [Streptosporangium sp. NPDC048865]|uniref:hypothetical protein n=1 Tax=Streptosporangium sp. NPDC048865 TaxID=3155766 RepID=UPI0034380195
MSAPLVKFNGQTLEIFHSDWFTINGEKNKDMPATASWPAPTHSKGPYVLEFFTPVTPTWIEMRFFREDRESAAGVAEGGRWKCDVEAKKCSVKTTENTARVTLPEKFFSGRVHKFTFQALWDVPPSQRHPGHSNSGAVIATWLYSQK